MNKLAFPVAIVLVLVIALVSSVIGVDQLASVGIERATAEQLEDGTVKSTMAVDVAQKLGSAANLIVGVLLTIFAWFKGWVNAIAQWVADITSSKPKAKAKSVYASEDDEEVEELPADRKATIEDMLLEAVYAKDRRKTILWCHELSGSEYLTKQPEPAQPAE